MALAGSGLFVAVVLFCSMHTHTCGTGPDAIRAPLFGADRDRIEPIRVTNLHNRFIWMQFGLTFLFTVIEAAIVRYRLDAFGCNLHTVPQKNDMGWAWKLYR